MTLNDMPPRPYTLNWTLNPQTLNDIPYPPELVHCCRCCFALKKLIKDPDLFWILLRRFGDEVSKLTVP